MRPEDILAIYEATPQAALKLVNSMSTSINKLKEQVKPIKEPKRPFKEKHLSRGQALSLKEVACPL